MTAMPPETDGQTPVGDRGGVQGAEQSMDLQAPLPDLSAMAAGAESAGKAWTQGAADWAESPQGAGAGGFTLGGATAGEWDSDVSFPHQGP